MSWKTLFMLLFFTLSFVRTIELFKVDNSSSLLVSNGTMEEDDGESARNIYDVLISIEEKLKSFGDLMQLDKPSIVEWLQSSSIERLARRIDAIETKLEHVENRFELGIDKLQETSKSMWEASLIAVDQKLAKMSDKIASEFELAEAKMNLHLESCTSKIDRFEMKLASNVDNILHRIDAMKDEQNTEKERSADIDDKLSEIYNNQQKIIEQLKNFSSLGDGSQEAQQMCPWSQAMAADDTSISANKDLVNITATLQEAVVVGGKKFQELDSDIEIYTRKVLNAYQELLKESKEVKDHLNKVIDHDNQTKLMIREGFRKLFQQIKPLSTLEEILQSLLKKILEMGGTVDSSFASLLVAQNTFISSCHRIQQQEPMIETKIYHLLSKHIKDIEERTNGINSCNTTSYLSAIIEAHRKDVGRALHDLVWTVISVGNQTLEEIKRLKKSND